MLLAWEGISRIFGENPVRHPPYYQHMDWLGTARFSSTPSQTMYGDVAMAPYGEGYAGAGTNDISFTGARQDTSGGVYDFLAREYSIQGRWPSPDPAGLAAVNPADPQTWNRYAYVRNSPVMMVDPTGLNGINSEGCLKLENVPDQQDERAKIVFAGHSESEGDPEPEPSGGCNPFAVGGGGGGACEGLGAIVLLDGGGVPCGIVNQLEPDGSGIITVCDGPACSPIQAQQGPGGTTDTFEWRPYQVCTNFLGTQQCGNETYGYWASTGTITFQTLSSGGGPANNGLYCNPITDICVPSSLAPRPGPTTVQRLKGWGKAYFCGSSPSNNIRNWMFEGAGKGIVFGAVAGGVTGTVLGTPVGGVFGAILGGLVDATAGAGGGVFAGSGASIGCSALGAYQ